MDNSQFHCLSVADNIWTTNDKGFIVCPAAFQELS